MPPNKTLLNQITTPSDGQSIAKMKRKLWQNITLVERCKDKLLTKAGRELDLKNAELVVLKAENERLAE